MINNLQPVVLAILVALLTYMFAQFMGMNMGLKEDAMKDKYTQLSQSISDPDEAKESAREAWGETKRAHAHFAGLAAIALVTAIIIGFTAVVSWAKTAVSLMISLGAFLYPYSVLIGAQNIAKMGEEAGKESVEPLVIVGVGLLSAGMLILITYLVLLLVFRDVSRFPKIFDKLLVK